MTATLTTVQTRTAAPPSLAVITEAADGLLDALTAAGLDDPRWESVGPLVSAAALLLREAIGAPVAGSSAGAPPIVRECDVATAARCLLGREVCVQNASAAHAFVKLATKAIAALS
jgi:hypothetical protein